MSILVVFLFIVAIMGFSLFAEGFLWPNLRKKDENTRIVKNEYVDDLFVKKSDYAAATQRKNTDLPIDKVFTPSDNHIDSFKMQLSTLIGGE